MLPVFLHCSEEEMARRIGNADRVEWRKLTSMEGLNQFRASYRDSPVPHAGCISLDTTAIPADATAREIIRRFALAG